MQRLLAMLLLASFSFTLGGPALFATSNSTLPACCRRAGKHHCVMQAVGSNRQASSRELRVTGNRCSSFPRPASLATHLGSAFSNSPRVLHGMVLNQPDQRSQTETLRRISFSRSRQKRGPPALLA